VIETVPPQTPRPLAAAPQVLLVALAVEVVFAGNVPDGPGLHPLKDLGAVVEFTRLGEVGQVAGVENERGRFGQCVDLRHRLLARRRNILVRVARETEVAVTDLDEGECRLRTSGGLADRARSRDSATQAPDHAGTHPGHAPEHSPAVNLPIRRNVSARRRTFV